MRAVRLANGRVRIPQAARAADGTLGDGVIEVAADSAEARAWAPWTVDVAEIEAEDAALAKSAIVDRDVRGERGARAEVAKHLPGRHDQREHGAWANGRHGDGVDSPAGSGGGSGVREGGPGYGRPMSVAKYPEKWDDISHEQRMAQANIRDIRATIAADLDRISSGPAKLTPVSGELSRKNIETIGDNARAELDRYTSYLAGDTTSLMHGWVRSTMKQVTAALPTMRGVQAEHVDALVRDSVRKLVFQEIESNRQQFTDHGIRHVLSNVKTQTEVAAALESAGYKISPRESLLANIAMVNHDVGYATPLVRAGGLRGIQASNMHKDFGAKIAEEQKGDWDEGKVFSAAEHARIVHLIKTHDGTDLSVKDPLALSVRLADNMALFHPAKLPSVFKYVAGSERHLVAMGKAGAAKDAAAFGASARALGQAVRRSSLSGALKRDLQAGLRQVNMFTPKFALGTLAGEMSPVKKGRGAVLETTVKHTYFDEVLQRTFDMGQKQTQKLLKDYGITEFDRDLYELGDDGKGQPVLRIRVQRSIRKAEDTDDTPIEGADRLAEVAVLGKALFQKHGSHNQLAHGRRGPGASAGPSESGAPAEHKLGDRVTLPKGTSVGMGRTKEDYPGVVTGVDTDTEGKRFYRVEFTDKIGRTRTAYVKPAGQKLREREATYTGRTDAQGRAISKVPGSAYKGVRSDRTKALIREAYAAGDLAYQSDGTWAMGPYRGKTAVELINNKAFKGRRTLAEQRAEFEQDKTNLKASYERAKLPVPNPLLPKIEAKLRTLEDALKLVED